ncbi:MAG: YjbH domain-containing protein, partial [Planctomycetota bacterium]
KQDHDVFPTADGQQNYLFAFGLFPRLTIGGRGAVVDQRGREFLERDLSANAQFLILEEEDWIPALAIGSQDIGGGATFFSANYAVVSKTFFGRLRGSLGLGVGPKTLEGVFGGVELAVNRYVTLMAEYDTSDFNFAARIFPLPKSLEGWGIPSPTIDIGLQDFDEFILAVGFRVPLGEVKYRRQRELYEGRRIQRSRATASRFERESPLASVALSETSAQVEGREERLELVNPGASGDSVGDSEGTRSEDGETKGDPQEDSSIQLVNPGAGDKPADDLESIDRALAKSPIGSESLPKSAAAVESALVEEGFENVRAEIRDGSLLIVEYENRIFARDELVGLGVVLGIAVETAPGYARTVRVITKRVNLPVLLVECELDEFRDFANGDTDSEAYRGQIRISNHVTSVERASDDTVERNRAWFRTDVFFRPGIATEVLTENSEGEIRFDLLPDAHMQLTPGTSLNARFRIPITATDGFPGGESDGGLDRLLVHQAARIPWGSDQVTGLTQLSLGRYADGIVGVSNETSLTLFEGWAAVSATIGQVGDSFGDLDYTVALGSISLRYPDWNARVRVQGGRFETRDTGVAVDISRFFGNTEIGLFLRHGDDESVGGVRIAIPLTLSRELPPYLVRPRLPDVFAYQQSTTVFTNRNDLVRNVAQPLRTGRGIDRVFWNRDRLFPAYVKRNLHVLRDAARRWVGE